MIDPQTTLNYFAQRSCARQWRIFLSELVSEFYDQVDRDLAESFFTRVGARLALAIPLQPCTSLDEVAADINRILDLIDWGWVEISEAEGYLRIVHGGYPVVPMHPNAPTDWLAPVLEGAYTEWLNAQGGEPGFKAVRQGAAAGPHEPLELLYGRH